MLAEETKTLKYIVSKTPCNTSNKIHDWHATLDTLNNSNSPKSPIIVRRRVRKARNGANTSDILVLLATGSYMNEPGAAGYRQDLLTLGREESGIVIDERCPSECGGGQAEELVFMLYKCAKFDMKKP